MFRALNTRLKSLNFISDKEFLIGTDKGKASF